MKTVVAIGVVIALLAGSLPAEAGGGGSVNAALALGSFAVFNQMLGGVGIFGPRWAYAAPAYYPTYYYPGYYPPAVYAPPVYYSAPPVITAPAPPPVSREVVYPHGRYVLQGDGVTVAYQWVWIPSAPPAPPAPPHGR